MATSALLSLLVGAVIFDLREHRIPNRLVLVGLILAALITVLGIHGAQTASLATYYNASAAYFQGIAVGFICMAPLYALGAMGAGDVKLMMMVGAFLGPLPTFGAAVLTFAAGGVLAIAMTVWQRSFIQLATNLRFLLTHSAVKAASGARVTFEPLQTTAGRMPYAVAIAAGTLLQVILIRSGGWALS